MDTTFSNNKIENRFELQMNGSIAFADYRIEGQILFIEYVEAPAELRGTGAAGKLMQHIVDWAEREKLSITPICGYAAAWMAKQGK